MDDVTFDLLTSFEDKHFSFDYDYYWESQCYTNRYYICLCEAETRHPNKYNKIKAASFRLVYEMFLDPFKEIYIFTTLKDKNLKASIIIDDIIKDYENINSVDAVLLTAKAWIKKAELVFEDIIEFGDPDIPAYVSDNKMTNECIFKATKLFNRITAKSVFHTNSKIQLDIAKCSCDAGSILMKTSSEGSVYAALIAEKVNIQAYKYFEKAHKICSQIIIKNNQYNEYLSLMIDILHAESQIINKRWYVKGYKIDKVDSKIAEIMSLIEEKMYLVLQSQKLCR